MIVCAILGYYFRGPILRQTSMFLATQDVVPEYPGAIAVMDGDRRYEFAAQMQEKTEAQILLFSAREKQIVSDGIVPALHLVAKEKILSFGGTEESIETLGDSTFDDWEAADLLGDWMSENANEHVVVLTSEFQTRSLRYVFDRVLGERMAEKVTVRGLQDRRFSHDDWWHSRSGVKSVFGNYLHLVTTMFFGRRDPESEPKFDPDAYDQRLRTQIGNLLPSTRDSSTPDSSTPDSSTPDSSTPDSSTPDSSTPDSNVSEDSPPEVRSDDAPVDTESMEVI